MSADGTCGHAIWNLVHLSEVGTTRQRCALRSPRYFFIIFVDAVFTTLLEALFTKLSDASALISPRACV